MEVDPFFLRSKRNAAQRPGEGQPGLWLTGHHQGEAGIAAIGKSTKAILEINLDPAVYGEAFNDLRDDMNQALNKIS
jgi:hypothetical protein